MRYFLDIQWNSSYSLQWENTDIDLLRGIAHSHGKPYVIKDIDGEIVEEVSYDY